MTTPFGPNQGMPAPGWGQPPSGGFPAQGGYPPPPNPSVPQPGFPGQPGGQFGPPSNPPRRSPALWIITSLIVLALVAVGVLGFIAPGFFNRRVLDNVAVQNGITGILKDYYKLTPTAVSCPADIPVNTGSTFTCTVTIDGQQQKVTSKITSSDGHYEVGQPQ